MDEIRDAFRRIPPGAVVLTGTLHYGRSSWTRSPRLSNGAACWTARTTLPLDHGTTIALADQAVLVPQTLMVDGQQPARMIFAFAALKTLQAAGHWNAFHDAHALGDADS